MTIDVDMGRGVAGDAAAALDLEELLATRLLVQGNSGSGKSHLLRRLLEQSAAHVQQIVVDPEGDFVTLAERYGHVVVDGERSPAELETIAGRLREHRVSAVLTLETLDAEAQMRAAAAVLNALFDAPRDLWFPALVVVDEAQLFAPAVSGDVSEEVRRLSLGAMTNLMCRGRKRGLAGIIATQRLAKLAKNVAAEATNFLMGRTFLDIDMARAADLLGLDRRGAEMFRDLRQGQFVALGPAIARRPVTIEIGGVVTSPRAAPAKLIPLPEQGIEAVRSAILEPVVPNGPRRLAEPRVAPPPVAEVIDGIERAVAADPPAAAAPPTAEERERVLRRAAFETLQVPGASFRPEPVLYADFVVRCRLLAPGLRTVPLAESRPHLAAARAGLDPDAIDSAEWERAFLVAATIPDDLKAVYLILAGSALSGTPCPSDAEVARRCGMHSAARARSRVGHLDRANLVVLRSEPDGRRSVILPQLGWQSAPGDPGAPAVAESDTALAAAE